MIANQYLLVDNDGITLIDTGITGNGKTILSAVNSLGLPLSTIKQILITHADGDHYAALPEILPSTKSKVYTSLPEADAMSKGTSSRDLKPKNNLQKVVFSMTKKLFQSPACQVDILLTPGETLPFWGGLVVLDTKGHTPGHISFYSPSKKILFAGDSIWGTKSQIRPSTGANTWDAALAERALQNQLDLMPRLICAGHTLLKI
jgi:glyoxylase-like metal-dependent hydrolase (beta-lactamase superfamily II)